MKNKTKIYTLIALLFLVQACGSKNESSSEKTTATGKDAQLGGLATLEQRRAIHKKDSAMIAEKRMKAWNEMADKSPTFTDRKGAIIYNKSEVSPTFVGGNSAMMKYLNGNVVYPEQAEKDELEGTVFVDFVVGSDGTVRDVEVTNATSTDVDQAFRNEAVRLVFSMPKWTPGSQNNVPVNVKYSIPVSFRII
ncbi:MAG: energy transducer TonB [Ekhidna sp.]|uniref:energy transducer TonB n=1 Tax=Ekhidna sp. TaxID=2608089 RepID=UPI0032EBF605